MALHCPDSMTAVAGFFNGLSLGKLDNLGDIYSPAVEFQDPIHQVRGMAALRGIYEDLFEKKNHVSMTVTDAHGDERTGFLLWTLSYQIRGNERVITGTSHLKFAQDGRVLVQRDHWDASFAIDDEFPLIGWAIRGIRRLLHGKPKPSGKDDSSGI